MRYAIATFLLVMATVLGQGCAMIEGDRCGNDAECCTLTDDRDGAQKSFCVPNSGECQKENDHQTVWYPSTPRVLESHECYPDDEDHGKMSFIWEARNERVAGELEKLLSGKRIRLVAAPGEMDCDFLCATGSALCNPIGATYVHADEMRKLEKLIIESENRVGKNKIMEIFGQSEDRCERGDLMINGDRFENIGKHEKCVVSKTLSVGELAESNTILMEVLLPSKLSGTLVRKSSGLKATFDPGSAPVLLYDGRRDTIYSGAVSSASTTTGVVTAKVGEACLVMYEEGAL